ncbi:hypothetical protein [Umezawaea sp. NPDC059074]|uniref:hypothetical protein n=1 Tax=Umezawaea sp. NPDC059074 TaxID=3346716 RepID=UPI0036C72143
MTFSALGWNPAPGEPDVVRRSAAELTGVSEIAEDAGALLRAISTGGALATWTGTAADNFRLTLEQLCADLGLLQRSYHDAAGALTAYASGLDSAQQEALRAESDAAAATADRDDAAQRVNAATIEARGQASIVNNAIVRANGATAQLALATATGNAIAADEQTRKLQQEQRTIRQANSLRDQANLRAQDAQRGHDAAAKRLDAAKLLGSHAQELREDAARVAEKALHAASDEGIKPLDPMTKFWDSTKEFLGSKEFDQFLTVLSDVGQLFVDMALPLTIVCAGVALLGGPLTFAAALAIGSAVSRIGVGLQAVAFVGRAAQTAVNPEHSDKLVNAGVALGIGAMSLRGGGVRGKVLELGGQVKRSLAYADNRTLSGAARKLLWTEFTVAKRSPAEMVSMVANGREVVNGMKNAAGNDLYADLTDYRPPGHAVVQEDTEQQITEFVEDQAIERMVGVFR